MLNRMSESELFFAGEQIAKGKDCPECGQPWLPLPTGYELVHGSHCPYVMTSEYNIAVREVVDKLQEAIAS